MSRNKGFSCLTKFCTASKASIVNGIFEVSFRLQKFLWAQKNVRTRNGFAILTFSHTFRVYNFRLLFSSSQAKKHNSEEMTSRLENGL